MKLRILQVPLIPNKISGFTLIEVLISLVVFAVGVLGLALHNGNTLQSVTQNNQRAIALNATTRVINDLYLAANNGATALNATINNFDNDASDSFAYTQILANENLLVTLSAAEDSSIPPKDLFVTDPLTWVSPLQLGVTVTFSGIGDNTTANDKKMRTVYAFLLP